MTLRLQARGLTWTPYGRRRPVLRAVDLVVEPGERVLLAGPTGSGKSTLLRALAGVLEGSGAGELTGQVFHDGVPVDADAGRAGLLVQDPRHARVAARVGRDVAFGCENAGMPRPLIHDRVAWALSAVGFPYPQHHPVAALSGGEAQRLALAGVIASRPGALLLDEPTAMLDAAASATVRRAVADVVAATGASLVVVEHRLEPWLAHVDRLVVLDADGQIVADGAPGAVLERCGRWLAELGVWVPGHPDPEPWAIPTELLAPARPVAGELVVAADAGLTHPPPRTLTNALGRPRPVVALAGADATVTAGRLLALRGPSGTGKSTLVSLLTGLAAPTRGRVRASRALARGLDERPSRWSSPDLAARVGWVPQDPGAAVVGRTVRDCLAATGRALGRDDGDRVEALAEVLGLSGALGRDPYALSGGERRRLALGTGLAHGPALLALDEPTVGQDRRTWAAVTGLVAAARDAGAGLVVATHDDSIAGLADATLNLREIAA